MTAPPAAFVQFPHPGGEHRPDGQVMAWNTGGHLRKFLISPGSYLADGEAKRDAELVYWGEWEPPSRIEKRWEEMDSLPRFLHRPYWARPTNNQPRQNTDPWVFGDEMLYSNCKQVVGVQRNPTSMQRLGKGSVICFGSSMGGAFCVDTVFVVNSSEPWTPAAADALDVDLAFAVCTAQSVACVAKDVHNRLTLYRGATYDNPAFGMYSFVPAKRADDNEPRFARPGVNSSFINPRSLQSTYGSKVPLPIDTVHEAWSSVQDQVLSQGLEIAVRIETPEMLTSAVTVPDNDLERC